MENEEKFFCFDFGCHFGTTATKKRNKIDCSLAGPIRRGLVSELYLVRERPGLSNERERERERKKRKKRQSNDHEQFLLVYY